METKSIQFELDIEPQPTDTTCGPSCLETIYKYLGLNETRETLIQRIRTNEDGGTLGVHLGTDALKQNFDVTIYTHNLKVFDPTWFQLKQEEIAKKLRLQSQSHKDIKTLAASKSYAGFIEKGGKIFFKDLTSRFLFDLLKINGPVICGLSSTYLYHCSRERDEDLIYDDINGVPQGHFVILSGINLDKNQVYLADPFQNNPAYKEKKYWVNLQHFINSVLIGVITYDANFILIQKKVKK